MLAAVGVFGTQQSWPDLTVAIVMALLALQGAWQIILHAKKDLQRNILF
jgi:Co/Zn/Cd efflux system component